MGRARAWRACLFTVDDRNSTGRQLPDNSEFAIVQLGDKDQTDLDDRLRQCATLAFVQCFLAVPCPLKQSVRDERLKFRAFILLCQKFDVILAIYICVKTVMLKATSCLEHDRPALDTIRYVQALLREGNCLRQYAVTSGFGSRMLICFSCCTSTQQHLCQTQFRQAAHIISHLDRC